MRGRSRLWMLVALGSLSCAGASDHSEERLATSAQPVKKGAVIVTEIFASPPGSSDGREWFEVHNTTADAIDLEGWTFKDDKSSTKIDQKVVVPAGGYAVLGQSDKQSENGGIDVDFAYGKSVGLSGTSDEVRLLDPDDKEIDAVVFQDQPPWPPATEGVAWQLDPSRLDATANDDGASWCLATGVFDADGSRGTPGQANPSCGGGTGGAAGSAGSPSGGQAGQAGGGSGAGMSGSSGQQGVAGAGGATGCQVRFSKIDVNQPDASGGPKDTAEAVELQVTGAFTAGKTRLADCGVVTLSPFDADADAAGACGPAAGTYAEVAVGALVVPASGFVVIGNIPEADLPLTASDGTKAAVLKNGPDYLALRGSGGALLAAVAHADNDAPTVLPSCPALASAEPVPADANTQDEPPHNQIAVRCPDAWRLVDAALVTWKAAPPCEASGAGGAGQGGTSSGTSGQGGGATSAGAAGAAGKGGTGGGAVGGASGASSGGATGGASAASGAAGLAAEPAAEDGDCSCRAAGGGSGAWGWLAVVGGLAAVGMRRRGRR